MVAAEIGMEKRMGNEQFARLVGRLRNRAIEGDVEGFIGRVWDTLNPDEDETVDSDEVCNVFMIFIGTLALDLKVTAELLEEFLQRVTSGKGLDNDETMALAAESKSLLSSAEESGLDKDEPSTDTESVYREILSGRGPDGWARGCQVS